MNVNLPSFFGTFLLQRIYENRWLNLNDKSAIIK